VDLFAGSWTALRTAVAELSDEDFSQRSGSPRSRPKVALRLRECITEPPVAVDRRIDALRASVLGDDQRLHQRYLSRWDRPPSGLSDLGP
jgi:hypothetical protein